MTFYAINYGTHQVDRFELDSDSNIIEYRETPFTEVRVVVEKTNSLYQATATIEGVELKAPPHIDIQEALDSIELIVITAGYPDYSARYLEGLRDRYFQIGENACTGREVTISYTEGHFTSYIETVGQGARVVVTPRGVSENNKIKIVYDAVWEYADGFILYKIQGAKSVDSALEALAFEAQKWL